MGRIDHQIIYALIAEAGSSKPGSATYYTKVEDESSAPKGEFEIVGEHPTNKKKVGEAARFILGRIPKSTHKRTYTQDNFHFHYKMSGTFCYFCVADAEFPLRICYDFLDDLEAQHLRTRTEKLKELIKDRMAHFNNPDNDKIFKIQGKVNEAKEVMMDNIDKILLRGEKLDILVDKTNDLVDNSLGFKKKTKTLKNRLLGRNILIAIVLIVIALIIIFVIIWVACGFPTFYRCRVESK